MPPGAVSGEDEPVHDTDQPVPPPRRGRRRGKADTRGALLRAAREVFTEQGYNRATVRAIASRAEVDPAMVKHWFGGKEGIFTAAVSIPVNPAELVSGLLDGDPTQLGSRILRSFLTAWDEAGGGEFSALVRSIATHDGAVTMLREFLQSVLFARLTHRLNVDQPEFRATLCATQMIGLGMARYVLELEPLAATDQDTVIAAIGPNLQRYLTGDIGGARGTPD